MILGLHFRALRISRAWTIAVKRKLSFSTSSILGVKSKSKARGHGRSSSSKWLQRQRNDPYVLSRSNPHKAQSLGLSSALSLGGGNDPTAGVREYVSRAAFKLWQLEEKHRFLMLKEQVAKTKQQDRKIVVDLGAAPGVWTQMAPQILDEPSSTAGQTKTTNIFALDMLPLDLLWPPRPTSISCRATSPRVEGKKASRRRSQHCVKMMENCPGAPTRQIQPQAHMAAMASST